MEHIKEMFAAYIKYENPSFTNIVITDTDFRGSEACVVRYDVFDGEWTYTHLTKINTWQLFAFIFHHKK